MGSMGIWASLYLPCRHRAANSRGCGDDPFPDLVAIGGQISKAGEFLMASTRDAARSVAIPSLYSFCQIVPARHIDDAGILGGAALAFEMFGAK